MTTTKHHTEEEATGFLVWADGLTLERDVAQQEAAELRIEIDVLRFMNERMDATAAEARRDAAGWRAWGEDWRARRDDWETTAEERGLEIDSLTTTLAGISRHWEATAEAHVEFVDNLRSAHEAEVVDLHAVIADLRRQLGIRP